MKLRNIAKNVEYSVNREELVLKLKHELNQSTALPTTSKIIDNDTAFKDMTLIHLHSPFSKGLKSKKSMGLENRALASYRETLNGFKKGHLLLVDLSVAVITLYFHSNDIVDLDNKEKEYLQTIRAHVKKLGKGNIWIYSTLDNKCVNSIWMIQ